MMVYYTISCFNRAIVGLLPILTKSHNHGQSTHLPSTRPNWQTFTSALTARLGLLSQYFWPFWHLKPLWMPGHLSSIFMSQCRNWSGQLVVNSLGFRHLVDALHRYAGIALCQRMSLPSGCKRQTVIILSIKLSSTLIRQMLALWLGKILAIKLPTLFFNF